MTNNITLAFIDIDPPVNIMLEPKQETTVFMLAETYKLLILIDSPLLLGHWYEIMALYYVKLILPLWS